jgi:predicted Zn-dependent protease with MMP-like domain
MNKEKFEQLVSRAVETLPAEFLDKLENITVMVRDYPTSAQLTRARIRPSHALLGLYEGIPLTKRGRHYSLVTPDKITIFKKPIESMCRDDAEIIAEIQSVVRHEIAHYFGIEEATLNQIEKEKFKHRRKGS